MDTLYEDDFLLLKGIKKNQSDTCIVSFTGVGHAMGGIDVQREEFVGSALKNGSVFFVTDKTRSWSNNICLEKIHKVFSEFGSFEKIFSIGNSMGGTNSLLLGPKIGAKTLIAFTPQYSVHPDLFPDLKSRKWMQYRNQIEQWTYKTVEDNGDHNGKEYIFHGDSSLELMHARKFVQKHNRVHLIIKGCGHDVAMNFKKKDVLSKVIDLCIAGANRDELVGLLSLSGIYVCDRIHDRPSFNLLNIFPSRPK